jgi:hypothetical protein
MRLVPLAVIFVVAVKLTLARWMGLKFVDLLDVTKRFPRHAAKVLQEVDLTAVVIEPTIKALKIDIQLFLVLLLLLFLNLVDQKLLVLLRDLRALY